LLSASCSKKAKTQRLLRSAKTFNDEARAFLLSGEADRSHKAAKEALISAQRAKKIAPQGPLQEMACEQMRKATLLAQAIESPEGSLRLWLHGISCGDTELAFSVFDTEQFVKMCFERRISQMTGRECQDLEESLLQSLKTTCQKYKDAFSTWKLREIDSVCDAHHAKVDCVFTMLDQKQRAICSLHRRDGIWRLFDVTDGERGLVPTLRDLSKGFEETDNIADFFEGKGLLEAYSVLEEAQQVDPLFSQKPWVGHYVRLKEPAALNRNDKKILVEEGRILKVVDYAGGEACKLLVVRTPDADPKESALGKIAIERAEHLGTDDGHLWGVGEISDNVRPTGRSPRVA